MSRDESMSDEATLDPPGTIAVIGTGPLGIEAALYGRYLGYDVTLIEGETLAKQLLAESDGDAPIPMRPDRCASPLARSALAAQEGSLEPKRSPTTVNEWLEQIWQPLLETDLLRGRILQGKSLTSTELVAVEGEDDAAVPPDFQLVFSEGEPLVCEAVVACESEVPCSFEPTADYYFCVRGEGDDPEAKFWSGLKQIVSLYASLGGRADLDLYRPLRS